MSFQTVFKRYELKYILTDEQRNIVLSAMKPYMKLDEYGRTTIRNIYYDTEDYRLVRQSIEKPIYKEKLRVRSYSQATNNSTVFVELKRKHDSIVYKRRMAVTNDKAAKWLKEKEYGGERTQISKEIDYFLSFYGSLNPVAYISYEREAFYTKEKSDFRVTFDDTILFRDEDISLEEPAFGKRLLPDGMSLMEIKCSGAIPIWMVSVLSENNIYKTTFSKYGQAYKTMILPKINNLMEERVYA